MISWRKEGWVSAEEKIRSSLNERLKTSMDGGQTWRRARCGIRLTSWYVQYVDELPCPLTLLLSWLCNLMSQSYSICLYQHIWQWKQRTLSHIPIQNCTTSARWGGFTAAFQIHSKTPSGKKYTELRSQSLEIPWRGVPFSTSIYYTGKFFRLVCKSIISW